MTKPYRKTEPREGLVQAKLSHRGVIDRKVTERVEWIPKDIKLGATVQVDGDTRYWRVDQIYKDGEILIGPVEAA